jgi:drug/metabolite transporter (DMT)-like permease
MLDFQTSLIIKIISAIFFFISGIVWKKVLTLDVKNYHFIFYRVVSSLLFLLLIKFYFLYFEVDLTINDEFSPSIYDWIVCILICLFSFWGLYFYTKALQNGRLSFIVPVSGITSFFSFITSILIFNEIISWSKYLSFLIIVIGLLIHQKNNIMKIKFSKEFLFTLLSNFVWGISFVLYLIPIKKFGVLNFSIILEICVFASCLLLFVYNDKKILPPKISNRDLLYCLLMGFLIAGGSFLSNFTLILFPVSLNILIGLIFEVLILATGFYFFKEKLFKEDWILISFITISTVLLLI